MVYPVSANLRPQGRGGSKSFGDAIGFPSSLISGHV
jgi:hypothetical protein